MHLDGKVFLVTGGASGLGEGAARALAAKGAHVAIIDRDVEAGQEIADELRGSFVEVDMCETASIEAAVAAVAAKCGRIDGCVNCAGTGMGQLVVNRKDRIHSAEDFEFIIKLNLMPAPACAFRRYRTRPPLCHYRHAVLMLPCPRRVQSIHRSRGIVERSV